MRKLWRTAFFSIIALLSVLSTGLFVPRAHAGAVPAAASPAKKKNKSRKLKTKKQKILKGRHGKHNPNHA